ncbi:hypothetical protein [Kocuria rosea]|uniref:Uncharacterized protein n=1 Tax=Kocuria rosea TaxID=1275 RepID=A0A4R5YN60_KOCRO|nr:hypothetical protein [Kocuria rosea]TDL46539.1 hypothetical protein E2R59_00495 [Kocuria rosea]
MIAAGWLATQGVRRWLAARRQRWVLQSLDGLQVDLQRHYTEICAHVAAHQVGAPGRDALAWALDQVEQVLQRRRQHEREPTKAPFIPHTQGVAVGLLGAAGAGMLILSML